MTQVVLLAVTGIGLGSLYFLLAGGLTLIFGLMRVLNLAHGAFLTVGAYAGYVISEHLGTSINSWWALILAMLGGAAGGAVFATLVEIVLIRRLYRHEIEQVLLTLGVALATIALIEGIWGTDQRNFATPPWAGDTTSVFGASVPNSQFICIAMAALVLAALLLFLRRTRYGLIIRAGVENRSMVTALGIDVRRAFTLVFAIGGAVAGLAGVLASVYYGNVAPERGSSLLIFALIVVVIGGTGSILGSAVAAIGLALVQQFVNYYGASGMGDFSVVLVLAAVLLIRPAGLGRRIA